MSVLPRSLVAVNRKQDNRPSIAGSATRSIERWRNGVMQPLQDHVAEEIPVAFVYNDTPFAVMMATPADLEDFATGFALSEGIVEHAAEVVVESIEHLLEGIEIHLRIPESRAQALESRRRSMSGRSGCGICGSELLESALRNPAPVCADIRIDTTALQHALRGLRAGQKINALTGATHAAGWASLEGELQLVREDVGRHNALDKLIGAAARAGIDMGDCAVVVTSRLSVEMIQKTVVAGARILASVSRPTAHALRLAEGAGLTLVSTAGGTPLAYCHEARLT